MPNNTDILCNFLSQNSQEKWFYINTFKHCQFKKWRENSMSAVWDFIHGNVTNVLILILSLLSIFDLLDMYGIEVKLFNYSKSRRRKEREYVTVKSPCA